MKVDVTDHAALRARLRRNGKAYDGAIDVVFANAGIDSGPGFVKGWVGEDRALNPEGALENYSDERWNRVIDINLNGIWATLREGARHMKPRKKGRMIVTTSLAGIQIEGNIGSAYMAAKAGAAMLMRTRRSRWRRITSP